MRAFLAVPSEAMWVESARGLVERLRGSFPKAAWTRPESWHLTLVFLGEVGPELVAKFSAAVEPMAAETVRGEIQAGVPTVFPAHGKPRVLGVGYAPSPALESLSSLASQASEAAARLGAPVETRPFHPHVTFARIRDAWPDEAIDEYRRAVASWPFPPWHARSCVLFESRLDPAGAVHTPLAEWSFLGGPRGVRA
jgi:RNA 2',3'-cyclic 3'-phosphodiesterase